MEKGRKMKEKIKQVRNRRHRRPGKGEVKY